MLIAVIAVTGGAVPASAAETDTAPVITSGAPVDAVLGDSYSFRFTATGSPAVTWSIDLGGAGGLEIDPATGELYGAPSPPSGTYAVTVTASNAAGSDVKQYPFRIVDAPEAPVITSGPFPSGTVGQGYRFALTATGSPAPTWSAEGLPAGLVLDRVSGVVSGTPTAAGSATVTVTASNGTAPDAVVSYPLTIAPVPSRSRLVFEPTSVRFGPQVVGSTSAPVTVVVRNSGDVPAEVTGAGYTGPGFRSPSRLAACNGGRLAAGASCPFTVVFAPTAAGPTTAALYLDTVGGRASLPLSGTAVAATPRLVFDPVSVAFGPQIVGSTSPPVTVTLRNPGNVPVEVTGAGYTGPGFRSPSRLSGCNGGRLAAGESCRLTLVFSPTAAGPVTANLYLDSNAVGGRVVLPLSGTGVAATPRLVFEPGSLTFGPQAVGTTSPPLTVTLRNPGNAPVEVSGSRYSGPGFRSPSRLSGCNAGRLAPGASCQVTFAFTPTAAGPASVTLFLESDAVDSPARLVLRGVGVAGRTG